MISMPWSVCPAISAAASGRVSSRPRTRITLVALCAVLLLTIPGQAQQSLLTRHVRDNGQAQPVGALPATQIMQLDIVLALSDQAGLDMFLSELYDPASPSYRHFLSVPEFTARFGPSQANYDAVVAFAKASGLTVVGGTRDGMEVQVKGPVSAIETAFHLNMRTYQHPTESRTFFAPDREPSVNLPFRLWHISGVDNYSIPHTMLVNKSDYAQAHGISTEAVVSHATTGSGPSASFLGSDMRAAYYGGTALTGAGQNLGLWEYEGTDLADLNTYFKNIGQTNNVPITLLSTDGTSTSCLSYKECDDTEQTLDMTQAIGMAPELSSLVMYIGSTDTAILSAMTTHSPLPATIGCSWGWTQADPSTLDPYFKRMAAQGQNFFAASGDRSTWSPSNEAWPADDANVVSVGGTDLITAGAGGAWQSETAWSDSGGGISPDSIAIPAWQQLSGVINSSNHGSTTLRNGPDVSANANFSFYTCADQTTCLANEYGGTSFAAPMWAGYMALVNQQLVANGEPTIGFLNPTIYAQNVTSIYNTDFHDITSGTSGSYSAVTGYDLVTGWGSPNGQNLINELGGLAAPGFMLSASPSGLAVNAGGTATATIAVQDMGGFTGSVSLAASGLPSGVTASFTPNPSAGKSVLSLTASSSAGAGTFNIAVTGTSSALTETTTLTLTVINSAQVTAPPPVNFGSVNVGTTSPAIPLVFTFNAGGTLSSTSVLTQGAIGLDFADAGTGTCVANASYTVGQTCTMNMTFTPKFDGTRYGAAVLKNSTGIVIGTGYIQGTGTGEGPMVNFLPGTQSTVVLNTSMGNAPFAVAVDGNGNVYVADSDNGVVWKEAPTASGYNQLGLIGSGLQGPFGLAVDGAGNVYIVDSRENLVYKEMLSGGSYSQTTICSGLNSPDGVAVDGSGNVYISDSYNYRVLKETLTPTGYTQSVVPTSGIDQPSGVAVDGNGNVYVADTYNGRVLEETLSAGSYTQSTVVSGLGQPQGIAVDGNGNVYIADSELNQVSKESPTANGYVQSVVASHSPSGVETYYGIGVGMPYGVAVDGSGNVFIADTGNYRVLKENFAVPPSLTFTNVSDGTTTTGSPQTVTVENVGSSALSFPIPSTGNNPNITTDFTLNSSGATACPLVNAGSSTAGTLAAGASCQLLINFTPPTLGTYSGSLALTDNNQNAAAPGYASQSIELSGTQVSPTFTLRSSIDSGAMSQGTSITSTITVIPQSGFTVNASLAASGLPSGLTASFTPNPTTGTNVLTLTASSSATPGDAFITITGTAGTQTATTMMEIDVVYVPPSFSLSASSAPIPIAQGSSNTSTIMVVDNAGFTGSVSLTANGLPSGVTASFSPNPTTGSSVLTLTASSSATPVSYYAVSIWGTSGTLTASTYVVLAIIPPPGFSPSSENFGAVYIGITSPAQILTYTFGSAVTLGSTAVLTQGAAGLDFTDAGKDTCTANTAYAAGQSCTVNVTFTPKFAGTRNGALVLNDTSGNVIATGYLQGSGVGPQINFLPGTESTVTSASNGLSFPYGIAVDGGENLYIADNENNRILKETLSAGTYTQSTIQTSSLNGPEGVAVDGSGNVYVADTSNSRVLKETPSVEGYIETVVASGSINGFNYPGSVAVDGSGNVYFTTGIDGSLYKETLSLGSYTQSIIPTPGASSGAFGLAGVAVDGSGNVYVVDSGNDQVLKETLSSGVYVQSILPTSGLVLPYGVAVDANGNVYIVDHYGDQVIKETMSGGSYVQSIVSTSPLDLPLGVAVDGAGNVYISDGSNMRVLKEDLADAPSLSFAGTAFGSTSPDSPQMVTVENVGNGALTFPIPSTGGNPSITANFVLNSSGSSACPLLSTGSSTAGTLAAGASCQLPISFTPTTAGALSGTLVLTDNNLNAAAPGYATQSIALSGTGAQATPTITWAAPAAITFGTALSGTQLNASSTVAGSFTYSPAAGTVLGAGQQTLTATFTPTDTVDYTTATASVTLTVNQATSTITWATPAAITYGTPLSGTQLNASSPVAGTFTYSPAVGTVLGAGQQTLTVAFTPTDTTDYTAASVTVTLTVNQATPPITWATPAAITYGTALSGVQLNASSTVAGSFTYSPAAGTVLTAGSHTLSVTFAPTDTTDYTTAAASVTLTVNQATPAITWATPAAITYGTPLSATQLNASSAVAGSFTYSPATGTVLTAGSHTLSVTFVPSDTKDYTTATASVTLTVNQATPPITWATPTAITYGTPLSATQLNASSTVAGSFTYSPAAGTVLNSGTQTLAVSFAPTDTTDYKTNSGSVLLTVNKAVLTISWATPAPITYGTALSATQLDASSTAAGTFAYSPAAGTVLAVGSHVLTVTLTPTIAANYTTATATATVTLTVNKAKPPITWATPAAITYGTALSATQLDASSTVAGTFTYSPAAKTVLSAGAQTLSVTFTPTNTTNYTTATDSVTLTVNKAAPVITWATPKAITYGTAISATQLNASSTVGGTFSYSPATGTVLTAGSQKLSVTFTPTNTTDYTTATDSVTLTVNKATPTVKLTSSASYITSGTSVTFTATLTGSGVKPTGTVTFLDGTTKLGTGTLNSSGVATFATSTLAVGRQSLTASYGGDGNYLTTTSTAITVTVTAK